MVIPRWSLAEAAEPSVVVNKYGGPGGSRTAAAEAATEVALA